MGDIIMANILIDILASYVAGGLIFAGYNILEISTLQRQNDLTRDKNLKNTINAQAKLHFDDVRGAWKWPYLLGKTAVAAIKWVKTI
jgi:hypothetical protein